MENTEINSPQHPEFRHKPERKKNRARHLYNTGTDKRLTHQSDHAAHLAGIHALLKDSPCFQGNFLIQEHGEKHANGHKAQSAHLNHEQDDTLSEHTPVGSGIHHNKACHAGGACCRKQSGKGRSHLTASCSRRQHQQKRPYGNYQKISHRNYLRLCQFVSDIMKHFPILFLLLFFIVISL